MPIIGHVGQRSWKVRVLNLSIHGILILGGVTMVYPFLVMLAGSVKSPVDRAKLEAVPSYLYDDTMLYKKYIEAKYNELTSSYALSVKKRLFSFRDVEMPSKPVPARVEDWNAFLDEALPNLDQAFYETGYRGGVGVVPEMAWKYRKALKAEADIRGNIEKLNDKYDTEFVSWEKVSLPPTGRLKRAGGIRRNRYRARCEAFIRQQNRATMLFRSVDACFVEDVLKTTYTADIRKMNDSLGMDYRSWREVCVPRTMPAKEDPLRPHWTNFVKLKLNLPFIEVMDGAQRSYQDMLREKYQDNIALFNQRYNTSHKRFEDISLPESLPTEGAPYADWVGFIANEVDPAHLRIRSLEFMYRDFLEKKHRAIQAVNEAHAFGLDNLDKLTLPEEYPEENTRFQDDWLAFAKNVAHPDWVTVAYGALLDYREFLTKPFATSRGDINVEADIDLAALNARYGTDYARLEDIQLPSELPQNLSLREAWRTFLTTSCKPALLRIDADKAAGQWQEYLREEYPSVEALNKAYGLVYTDFARVVMPIEDADYVIFESSRGHLRREFLSRNYRIVLDLLLYSGRALMNTVIYCSLAVMAALLVNPLAAYALSRYKPPSAYKILLFFMLTMAFPPMVLGIPKFILIRKLHLLNTFAALILPGLANGYSIFLLKGFFDSLPRELYESASLDGASEWTMFWQITMATSKPILAVIALGAFTAAYGNFMMAFILCQNPKMWTMMVNVYQLMQRYNADVGYAAVVIAAIPTFIVFIFCQNIIIRGIVVPTEK